MTQVLRRLAQRDGKVCELAVEAIYKELRKLVLAKLPRPVPGDTLQPTALVNELYLRLFTPKSDGWNDRGHFFATAATAVRTILVDHARRKNAIKRRPPGTRLELDEVVAQYEDRAGNLIDLNDALKLLEQTDPAMVRLVELRFFFGLSTDDIAAVSDRSTRSVNRDLTFAKQWIAHELQR